MNNVLVVLEDSKMNIYQMDEKTVWEVGRPHKDITPDIGLLSSTVSRKHGKFESIDGIWFYLDNNKKNGTSYNNKRIGTGISGRVKPILLNDGDTLIFGGGQNPHIGANTAWALYLKDGFDGSCRFTDTKGNDGVTFSDGEETVSLKHPEVGTVIKKNKGVAIYMGDVTYLMGSMEAKAI